MASLPRTGLKHIASQQQLLIAGPYRTKNPSLKHRNYSNSKLVKTLMHNESKSQNFLERNGIS